MSAGPKRDEAFWRLIGALDRADALRHVMMIGTWAEWLYSDYFEQVAGVGEIRVDIGKTHDIDVCFRNYLMDVAQKLFINPGRRPERKRPQDIRKVKVLLQAMENVPCQMENLEGLLGGLPADKRNRIQEVAKTNSITLPWEPENR